ncbi:MAG TPA: HD domain-containing phosphohydrolase [Clostridia bacterium]
MNQNNLSNDDDFVIFEDVDEDNLQNKELWKVIVADDDAEVHRVTKLVLKNFEFEGKGLNILSAYSEAEVKEMIFNNPDTTVLLLDVIMERDDSGLNVVKYIRDELKNRTVRIILRTGQPGQAPEEKTIVNYDINDYKEKTELTSKKLFTSMISALRTYRHIIELENSKKGLEKIILSTSEIFNPHLADRFYDMLLKCFLYIITNDKKSNLESISGLVATSTLSSESYVVSGIGNFVSGVNLKLAEVIGSDDYKLVIDCLSSGQHCVFKDNIAMCSNKDVYPYVIIFVRNTEKFSEMDRNLLSIFYSNVCVSLNNMYLMNEIESTQKEILFTLGGIAEARSKELGQHVIRVAEFAKIISLGYGLSEEEAELVRQAAPMHDIGKIAIPDDVLNKPGKLTEKEFDTMKTHTLLGYELLKTSNRKTLKAAAIIALEHHEKYNGTGYPNGLKGEDIHIYGRIAAIADVFDALGCERVYKKAWELDRILELFKQESGKHFDPCLVEILMKNLDEILKVKNMLPD